MITIVKIAAQRLLNNKTELLLIFVVPIIFFSIFAFIFTRGISGAREAPEISLVDEDQSDFTTRLRESLQASSEVNVHDKIYTTSDAWPIDRINRHALETHNVDAVVLLAKECGTQIANREPPTITIATEGSDPFTSQVTKSVILQAVAASLQPKPIGVSETETQTELVTIQSSDVYADGKRNPKIAMYAAGIAVMFLLFSATGSGGSLLDESEAGTLDRLLCSRLSLTQLLLGKWIFITLLGCVQITVMFAFAQFVYQVDLLGHLPGFAVMTVCTAAATASFALCLAAACSSRSQLQAVSTVLILSMSALGGSMIPRYIMSDSMRRWGQWTFNGWALDGYQKVFWYDMPISKIATEAYVLLGMAVFLAIIARMLMERWNAA